jgi:hypothetical protein
MNHLEEILNMVDRIPPFPKMVERVMTMLRESNVTVKMLAEAVQFDQAITVNVLKICNSAYFGLSRKVSSHDEALGVIGHDFLKNDHTSSSAPFYRGKVSKGYYLQEAICGGIRWPRRSWPDCWRGISPAWMPVSPLLPVCCMISASAF